MLSFLDRYSQNLTIYDTLQTNYTLTIGSTVEFTCLAIANDVNLLEFVYRKNDGSLADNVDRTAIDGTNIDARTTMRINEVREENAGQYECIVRNFDGGDSYRLAGRIFTIELLSKSVIILTMKRIIKYVNVAIQLCLHAVIMIVVVINNNSLITLVLCRVCNSVTLKILNN